MSKKFNHTFNFVASLDSDIEDFADVPAAEIICAMQKRLKAISEVKGNEAFELLGTIDNAKAASGECYDHLPSESVPEQAHAK